MKGGITLLIGILFGTGVAGGGMANPAKVLNFFDVAGNWDPSLVFVMAGALLVAIPGYALVLHLRKPIGEPVFDLPAATAIDRPLITGAAVFGFGWGIAGFCPGGAFPALGTGAPEVVVFVVGLVAGIATVRMIKTRQSRTV